MVISGVFELHGLHYVTVYAKIKNIKRKFELSSTQWSLSESLNVNTSCDSSASRVTGMGAADWVDS